MRPAKWDIRFNIFCDANAMAVGSTLCQSNGDKPVAYASRLLAVAEHNYSTTKREGLAMVFLVKKFHHYFLSNLIVFFVDHMAILFPVNKPKFSGRLARWVLLLDEIDYTVEYKPMRHHLQADHLSMLSKK